MTAPQRVDVARLAELLAKATPGPWRWEYNATSKGVEIAGGKPTFDKTVMDFARWGTHRATPRFSGAVTDADGFCILHRLSDRPDWTSAVDGREHHADWFKDVTHPDAALMVAAVNALPALLQQLAERDAEIERLQKVVAGEVTIEELHIVDGRIDAKFGTEMATFMARTYLDLCDAHGAQNYLEMRMADKEGREVIVTAQRGNKPTPHELRQAAERAREEACRLLREATSDYGARHFFGTDLHDRIAAYLAANDSRGQNNG